METSPTEIVVGTLALSESGFLGRYTGGGRLQSTYEYLIENPFRPIGLTYDPRVSLGDNFIAEYIIRGSVPLYMAVLIASALFWRRNLGSRGAAAGFFLFFLACDIGYPLLPYYRTAGAIILFVIVWNYCSTSRMRGGGDRGGERNYHSTENYDSLR